MEPPLVSDNIAGQSVALLGGAARRSFQDIGGHVALSAPAVKRRVDRLRRDGGIRGFTTLIDPRRVGGETPAILELPTEGPLSGTGNPAGDPPHPRGAAPHPPGRP